MNIENRPAAGVYKTSGKEMDRRKAAFRTFCLSMFISTIMLSYDVIIAAPEISLAIMAGAAILFVLSYRLLAKNFEDQKQLEIHITEDILERAAAKSSGSYLFSEINYVRIKRTVKGNIKEIEIKTSKNQTIYINGLENFELFAKDLISRVKSDTVRMEYHDKFDFNRLMFYILFGLAAGILLACLIRFI